MRVMMGFPRAWAGLLLVFVASNGLAAGQTPALLLNELDADQTGTDAEEFVEIRATIDGVSLTDVFVVQYNGNAAGDAAYRVVDLGGFAMPADRLFVVGSALVPEVDLIAYTSNGLQNGADAVALFHAPGLTASDFSSTPAASPPPGAVLLDALVYDTGDADDTALLGALTPGHPQADEAGLGLSTLHSLQRDPAVDTPFDSASFRALAPTPGAPNASPLVVRIHDIQGAAHRSPLENVLVADVEGIVTAVGTSGFWMQDLDTQADGLESTSEALYVRTSGVPGVSVSQQVQVSGVVVEHRPGGDADNLSTTELQNVSVQLVTESVPLPAPTVLGAGGRTVPNSVIDDDTAGGNVETGTTVFDPAFDGLDFYESLEGMVVRVDNAIVVGPTSAYGEVVVVGDAGALATGLNARGGLTISPSDFGPERIVLDDGLATTPWVSVGDSFSASPTGVLHYSYGAFKLKVTTDPVAVSGGLGAEQALPSEPGTLQVACLNVENLSPSSSAARFAALAERIVTGLGSPDLVGVAEVQDNSGIVNDGVTQADQTWALLVAAITAAGGPAYSFTDIAPLDGQDGGQPGGNIRCGFLLRTDRGLELVLRPGGDALSATAPVLGTSGVELTLSPGRVGPADPSFASSRKPLAAEFRFNGHPVIAVVNHFRSKGGDDPLFGVHQPPVHASEVARQAQAQVVADFASSILGLDSDAAVIVLGDLNDFGFSGTVQTLVGAGLTLLTDTLPQTERYTYVYQGNSQALDHVLVSPALSVGTGYDIVHGHAEYPAAASDHDPCLASLRVPGSPWLDLGQALAGGGGPPRLDGVGSLQPGTSGALRLGGGAPSSQALLLISDAVGSLPFKGGTLVPFPLLLALPLVTDGSGAVEIAWTAWPAGLPSGQILVFQTWVADAGGVQGAAASNALQATAP